MRNVSVHDFDSWRAAARAFMRDGVPPEQILWHDSAEEQQPLLIGSGPAAAKTQAGGAQIRVPRRFAELARWAACHRNPVKWDILYRLLWRIEHENRKLLDVASDQDVLRALDMAAQVRRDEHKMRAFVRFSRVDTDEGERYMAWYRPDHLIVKLAAPFFADRFASMRWSILTPDLSMHWDGANVTFTPGVPASMRPREDRLDDLWRTYYAAVFNPARVNVKAMRREMPTRHWGTLPEARIIPALVMDAATRTDRMVREASAVSSARPFVPMTTDLEMLRAAARTCRGCDLHCHATQVVFGEGAPGARIVLVGEQPGDSEDLQGRPFVGPAGEVLDRALQGAGVPRDTIYVTNAVKHFTFEPRGKRRIHQTPRLSDVRACRPWLEAELRAVRPDVVVCMGGTAARSLLGPQMRVMENRGRLLRNTPWAESMVVTVHPSAVLRAEEQAPEYFQMLVDDLRLAHQALVA